MQLLLQSLLTRAGLFSIERIVLTNAGAGYTQAPLVTISGGGGVGAAATAALEQSNFGIVDFVIMTNNGVGYAATPTVSIVGASTSPAAAEVNLLADNTISDIFIKNAGIGYTQSPTVVISSPSTIQGVGNFTRGEIVKGVYHQVLRQELRNGILIQEYSKYQTLVLEQLKGHLFLVKPYKQQNQLSLV